MVEEAVRRCFLCGSTSGPFKRVQVRVGGGNLKVNEGETVGGVLKPSSFSIEGGEQNYFYECGKHEPKNDVG